MLPLKMRREYEDIVFFWKCLHGMYDINVHDFVKFSSDSQHVTCRSNDSGFLMISSLCRTDCFQRSFLRIFFRIVQIWNSLPQSIRCISVYNTFVSELKLCFLEKVDSQFMSNDCSWHFRCLCNNCRL